MNKLSAHTGMGTMAGCAMAFFLLQQPLSFYSPVSVCKELLGPLRVSVPQEVLDEEEQFPVQHFLVLLNAFKRNNLKTYTKEQDFI